MNNTITTTPKYDFSTINTIVEEINAMDLLHNTVVVKVEDIPLAIGMFFPDDSGKLGMICKLIESTDFQLDFAKKLTQHTLHNKYNNWTNRFGSFPFSGNIAFQKDGELNEYSISDKLSIKDRITYDTEFISGKKTRTIHNVLIEELISPDYSEYQDGVSAVCKMNYDLY